MLSRVRVEEDDADESQAREGVSEDARRNQEASLLTCSRGK